MQQGSYVIDGATVGKFVNANGVYVDENGAWLGQVVEEGEQQRVEPYYDDAGSRVPAPEVWQCLIVRRLR